MIAKHIFIMRNFLRTFVCMAVVSAPSLALGQDTQVYDDFEGKKSVRYGERTGVLDTAVANPAPGGANQSKQCALYVRNSSRKFANIKMNLAGKLTGVEKFATYEGVPPALKMRVYTSAPVGTLVEILLGSKRGNNDYPAGTHSQYQAYTTKTNEWEELTFKFSQIPQGSETAADQIDQMVLLFNPNSSTSDTYYFDEITGPAMSADESGKNMKKASADAGAKQPAKAPAKKAAVKKKDK
jgi:hypothetical protein